MMPLFYRLRRSVALIVCPELSAESRLKATLAEARAMRVGGFVPRAPRPSIWERILAAAKRLDHSLLGDVAGAVLLFAVLIAILSIGGR